MRSTGDHRDREQDPDPGDPRGAGGPGSGPSTAQALLAFRIIGASMALGVTLFAFVSWFLHLERPPEPPAFDPELAFTIWLAVAVVALATAIVFWRFRIAPLVEGPASPEARRAGAGELQTNVIVVWALAEAPALLAVVIYFLYGSALLGVLGVALIWLAVGLTWPRREWFGIGP